MGGNRTARTQGINNNRQCLFYLENYLEEIVQKGDFDYGKHYSKRMDKKI